MLAALLCLLRFPDRQCRGELAATKPASPHHRVCGFPRSQPSDSRFSQPSLMHQHEARGRERQGFCPPIACGKPSLRLRSKPIPSHLPSKPSFIVGNAGALVVPRGQIVDGCDTRTRWFGPEQKTPPATSAGRILAPAIADWSRAAVPLGRRERG